MLSLVLYVMTFAGLVAVASAKSFIPLSLVEVAILTAGLLVSSLFFTAIYPFWFSPLRHLPTAEGSNIVTGHMLSILTAQSPFEHLWRWSHRWPDAPFVRFFSLGYTETLMPNSVEAIKGVVFTKAYQFDKAKELKIILAEFMSGGVLFAMGDAHKRLKRLMTGPVSKAAVRPMVGMIKACAADMCAVVEQSIRGEAKGVVEAEQLISPCTLSVIGLAIAGQRLTTMRSRKVGLTFAECYYHFLSPSLFGGLLIFLNTLIPLRWLPIEINRRHFEASKEMSDMIDELIEDRTAEAAENIDNVAGKPDMLSRMIMANREKHCISRAELKENLIQAIMAGHETETSAIVMLCAALAPRPNVVARLRQEIADARSQHPELELDGHAIEDLHYLHNVVRESLRLYPPTISLNWQASESVEIEGTRIPKGTRVSIYPSVINRHPQIWGEDAAEFDPDRWDRLAGLATNMFAFQTFLQGPRICPGAPLALMEMKIILMELIDRFDFEMADKTKDWQYRKATLNVKVDGGLQLRFRHRDPQQAST